jgi:predicted DCC family thiol-disulfide oxidoreductase YuxK
MSHITVIFDGQCEFCQQSVTWIQRKLEITALPFQTSDLSSFNLTLEQCAKQVYVVSDGITYAGAPAIAFLLKRRGNRIQSGLITASGPIGRASYRWIAGHRNSWPVKFATKVLTHLNVSNSR